MSLVDIIVPTWNNPQYMIPCLTSILQYTLPINLSRIILVNNGLAEHADLFKENKWVTILNQKENRGWVGGLQAGLEVSKSPYVVFMNDDTLLPSSQRHWLTTMLNHFAYPDCAAVGPTSNVVMGPQTIFSLLRENGYRVKYLIGFCLLVKRSDLDAAGGLDNTLPGGDDLDLSIRLRKLGKYLICDRDAFIYHHGFKSGQRVHGSDYNSIDMVERTNHALIRKHGLREFLDLWGQETTPSHVMIEVDREADVVREFVTGEHVAELGCGHMKTVPNAVGIDVVPKGGVIDALSPGYYSIADVTADVQHDLPVEVGSFDTVIARHVLEHMPNLVEALAAWGRVLKQGGRLVLAVPNHDLRDTIPLERHHVHAFNPKSLKDLMESLGWKTIALKDPENLLSFVGAFEKNGLH